MFRLHVLRVAFAFGIAIVGSVSDGRVGRAFCFPGDVLVAAVGAVDYLVRVRIGGRQTCWAPWFYGWIAGAGGLELANWS